MVRSILCLLVSLLNCNGWSQSAQTRRELANYTVGACSVRESKVQNGIYEYRVDGPGYYQEIGPSYVTFEIASGTGELVGGINTCNGDSRSGGNPSSFTVQEVGQYLVYSAQCGGLTSRVDGVLQLIVNKGSGKISFIFADLRVVKWGLPDGLHSGPIKTPRESLLCSGGSSDFSGFDFSSRQQIERAIRTSSSVKPFLSRSPEPRWQSETQ